MAGVWTSVCVMFPALTPRRPVQGVRRDGWFRRPDEMASRTSLARFVQGGVIPTTTNAVLSGSPHVEPPRKSRDRRALCSRVAELRGSRRELHEGPGGRQDEMRPTQPVPKLFQNFNQNFLRLEATRTRLPRRTSPAAKGLPAEGAENFLNPLGGGRRWLAGMLLNNSRCRGVLRSASGRRGAGTRLRNVVFGIEDDTAGSALKYADFPLSGCGSSLQPSRSCDDRNSRTLDFWTCKADASDGGSPPTEPASQISRCFLCS